MAIDSYRTLLLGAGGLVLITIFLFRVLWRTASRGRSALIHTTLALHSLLLTLLLIEGVFRFFVVQSDSLNFTLSAQRWTEKYFKPINSKGFRDLEHTEQSLRGRKILVVVGDSFVAGHGIDDCADRFSDRLQQRLGHGWAVVNLGKNGWATTHEFQAVQSFPFRPDRIILSYYVNDIMDAAARHGHSGPYAEPPAESIRGLVNHSHLVNFLYWRWYRVLQADWPIEPNEYFRQLFHDPVVWEEHARELHAFVEYGRKHEIPLTVVAFPNLRAVEETRFMTAKVAQLFRKAGITVVDLGEHLAGRDASEFVVNAVDAHAGVSLNHEVAELLEAAITTEAGIAPQP